MKLLIQEKPCILGESPHWDEATQTLYWVDIFGKKIYQYQTHQNQLKEFILPEMVGHVIPVSTEELMISMPSGIYKFTLSNQKYTKICTLEPKLLTQISKASILGRSPMGGRPALRLRQISCFTVGGQNIAAAYGLHSRPTV